MAIDIKTEKAIPVRWVTKLMGSGKGDGDACHVSRVIRLILKGDLEGFRIGNRWMTSLEAVQRYVDRTSNRVTATARPLRGPVERRRAMAGARARVEKAGI